MTQDELSYVLERKFPNIKIHHDVIISNLVSTLPNGGVDTSTAYIMEWNINYISQPSTDELNNWWDILSEQYHSDHRRVDSLISKYLHTKSLKNNIIIVNNSI